MALVERVEVLDDRAEEDDEEDLRDAKPDETAAEQAARHEPASEGTVTMPVTSKRRAMAYKALTINIQSMLGKGSRMWVALSRFLG